MQQCCLCLPSWDVPSLSKQCIADLMFVMAHKPRITARICHCLLSMSMGIRCIRIQVQTTQKRFEAFECKSSYQKPGGPSNNAVFVFCLEMSKLQLSMNVSQCMLYIKDHWLWHSYNAVALNMISQMNQQTSRKYLCKNYKMKFTNMSVTSHLT